MPRKRRQRVSQFAGLLEGVFRYPHCSKRTPISGHEIDRFGRAFCKSCRRVFLPWEFTREPWPCDSCGRMLSATPQYRDGLIPYRLCQECAPEFDAAWEDGERIWRSWQRGIMRDVKEQVKRRRTEVPAF